MSWLATLRERWLGSDHGVSLDLDWATAQDRGDRKEQQDRYLVLSRGPWTLLVVADGLGGLQDGALASRVVTDAFTGAWRDLPEDRSEAGEWLEAACLRADQAVLSLRERRGGVASGSTVAALLIGFDRASWAHVGDSRIYLIREDRVLHRTRDHSLAELLGEEEAGDNPNRHALTQCLGGEARPRVSLGTCPLRPGDGVILASDGVWGQLPETALLGALDDPDLPRGARALVREAVGAGRGRSDNVTVVLARIGRESGVPRRVEPVLSSLSG